MYGIYGKIAWSNGQFLATAAEIRIAWKYFTDIELLRDCLKCICSFRFFLLEPNVLIDIGFVKMASARRRNNDSSTGKIRTRRRKKYSSDFFLNIRKQFTQPPFNISKWTYHNQLCCYLFSSTFRHFNNSIEICKSKCVM